MQQLTYNLNGISMSYAESIGSFLRNTYFLRTRTAKCCGIEGSFLVDGKTCPISASVILPGNSLVYDLFLNLNSLNFEYVEQCLDLNIGKTLVPPNSKYISQVTRLSDEIFSIKVSSNEPTNIITSKILGEMVSNDSDVILLKHFHPITAFDITIYLRIGNGCYSDLQNKEDLEALKINAMTYPVMCSPNGDLGYQVSGDDRNSKLSFNYNEKLISESELREIFSRAVSTLSNIF